MADKKKAPTQKSTRGKAKARNARPYYKEESKNFGKSSSRAKSPAKKDQSRLKKGKK